GSVSVMVLKQVLAIAALLGLLSEARAEPIEVFVPSECQSLAQEFGVPPVLRSKVQVTYALYKLRRVDGSRSGVAECRAAVERLRGAYRAQKAPVSADRATATVNATELPEQR